MYRLVKTSDLSCGSNKYGILTPLIILGSLYFFYNLFKNVPKNVSKNVSKNISKNVSKNISKNVSKNISEGFLEGITKKRDKRNKRCQHGNLKDCKRCYHNLYGQTGVIGANGQFCQHGVDYPKCHECSYGIYGYQNSYYYDNNGEEVEYNSCSNKGYGGVNSFSTPGTFLYSENLRRQKKHISEDKNNKSADPPINYPTNSVMCNSRTGGCMQME
jgi:hypothetical protein